MISKPKRTVWDFTVLVPLAIYSKIGSLYSRAGYEYPNVTKVVLVKEKFGSPPAQGRGPVFAPGIPSSCPTLSLVEVGNSNWCACVMPNVASIRNVGLTV